MIAHDYPVSQLFAIGEDVVYVVPPYQREYKWGKEARETFFKDIFYNDIGYFLGSIICIDHKEQPLIQRWELVDGQQRMVTLSLMFAAIYSKLNELKERNELNDDQKNDLFNLKRELVLKKNENMIRVVPQIQNSNEKDYRAILAKAGVIKQHIDVLPNAGNRGIFKAYKQFQNKLDKLLSQSDGNVSVIFELLEKVNTARLVMIDAGNTQGAYALFTALNDRGAALNAVDLIKTAFFANIFAGNKEPDPEEIKRYSENWNHVVARLGEEDAIQERFFRQYYNAFLNTSMNNKKMSEIAGYSIATRSNLIKIYERIIKEDPEGFFNKIIEASRLYSIILSDKEESPIPKKPLFDLKDLKRIEGTPSYLLLLYLIEKEAELKLEKEHLCDVVDYLVRFFVRRNLTDRPATNSLTPLFMKIVDGIVGLAGVAVVEKIKYELVSISSNDKEFREYLEGPIYSESSSVDRFILCAIESKGWPEKEPIYDLWRKENGKFIWTIEHIFPQGKKIPQPWIDMIADGDEAKAKDIQARLVDRLGNLTLTGYNPDLGSMSFEKKRDRTKRGKPIGYHNQLNLNKDIGCKVKWTVEDIQNRTTELVNKTLELFALEDKNKLIEAQ